MHGGGTQLLISPSLLLRFRSWKKKFMYGTNTVCISCFTKKKKNTPLFIEPNCSSNSYHAFSKWDGWRGEKLNPSNIRRAGRLRGEKEGKPSVRNIKSCPTAAFIEAGRSIYVSPRRRDDIILYHETRKRSQMSSPPKSPRGSKYPAGVGVLRPMSSSTLFLRALTADFTSSGTNLCKSYLWKAQ